MNDENVDQKAQSHNKGWMIFGIVVVVIGFIFVLYHVFATAKKVPTSRKSSPSMKETLLKRSPSLIRRRSSSSNSSSPGSNSSYESWVRGRKQSLK